MAKPHGKSLLGKEGGRQAQHWYDFIKPKRFFLSTRAWDGGCPSSKPGLKVAVWLGFDEFGKPKWGT